MKRKFDSIQVKFQKLTAGSNAAFLDVAPCILIEIDQRFALITEAVRNSETWTISTRLHGPTLQKAEIFIDLNLLYPFSLTKLLQFVNNCKNQVEFIITSLI
jgi:hypothetical protein